MATVTVFIYRNLETNPRGNCPVCKAWNGRESRNREDLPPAPNPACLEGVQKCHCFIETVERDEKDIQDGGAGGDDGGGGGGGSGDREGFGFGGGGLGGGGGGGGGGGDGDVSISWDPYYDWWWEEG